MQDPTRMTLLHPKDQSLALYVQRRVFEWVKGQAREALHAAQDEAEALRNTLETYEGLEHDLQATQRLLGHYKALNMKARYFRGSTMATELGNKLIDKLQEVALDQGEEALLEVEGHEAKMDGESRGYLVLLLDHTEGENKLKQLLNWLKAQLRITSLELVPTEVGTRLNFDISGQVVLTPKPPEPKKPLSERYPMADLSFLQDRNEAGCILILGKSGAGKSTIGKWLARSVPGQVYLLNPHLAAGEDRGFDKAFAVPLRRELNVIRPEDIERVKRGLAPTWEEVLSLPKPSAFLTCWAIMEETGRRYGVRATEPGVKFPEIDLMIDEAMECKSEIETELSKLGSLTKEEKEEGLVDPKPFLRSFWSNFLKMAMSRPRKVQIRLWFFTQSSTIDSIGGSGLDALKKQQTIIRLGLFAIKHLIDIKAAPELLEEAEKLQDAWEKAGKEDRVHQAPLVALNDRLLVLPRLGEMLKDLGEIESYEPPEALQTPPEASVSPETPQTSPDTLEGQIKALHSQGKTIQEIVCTLGNLKPSQVRAKAYQELQTKVRDVLKD